MSSEHRRRRGEAPADDLHEIDPSAYFEPHAQPRAREGRKTQQLCREVERTLIVAFAACTDAALRTLLVVAVEPAPDSARLLVTLAPASGQLDVDVGAQLKAIGAARGRLRAEVAAALQRKRTPELIFRILPAVPS
jgi:ribosome-binding factor A